MDGCRMVLACRASTLTPTPVLAPMCQPVHVDMELQADMRLCTLAHLIGKCPMVVVVPIGTVSSCDLCQCRWVERPVVLCRPCACVRIFDGTFDCAVANSSPTSYDYGYNLQFPQVLVWVLAHYTCTHALCKSSCWGFLTLFPSFCVVCWFACVSHFLDTWPGVVAQRAPMGLGCLPMTFLLLPLLHLFSAGVGQHGELVLGTDVLHGLLAIEGEGILLASTCWSLALVVHATLPFATWLSGQVL